MNSNDNKILTKNNIKQKKKKIEKKFEEIFDIMDIDWKNDHNMKETPYRIAKMYIDEVFSGCYTREPKITIFPNDKKYDEMVVSGPIQIKSMCSHHFMPFFGKAWIGYMPDKKVIGVSKLSRLARWFARRPQIQEELGEQIADYIESKIEPAGVAVFIKAKHQCMTHRGVNEPESEMITSVVRGKFKGNHSVKMEFLNLIKER